MSQGIQTYDNFQRVLTFTGFFQSTGEQLKFVQNRLGAPVYPVGLSYKSGAILALDNSGDFTPYNSAGGAPFNVAVGILFDDRLPFSDDTGDFINGSGTVVGEFTQAVMGGFRVDAAALFGILLNLSDVAAGMASMGANFDPLTNSYSLF